MESYLILFGRTPALALLELQAFSKIVQLAIPTVAIVDDGAFPFTPEEAMVQLGGAVKIAQMTGTIPTPDPETLAPLLAVGGRTRVVFGISVYGQNKTPILPLLQKMKEILATYGISGRFVMSKDDELSSVTVAREHIRELVLVQTNGSWIVGKTLAVQQFAQWAQRDYGRPFSDPKSGMLPPKVARMAVNIALGQHASGRVLYDPFCGMGTILAEALMRGATVLGSDQASDAVSKTKANLDWLVARTPSASYRSENIFVSDATHASTVVAPNSVDAIVTEPFMGSSGIAQSLIQGDNRDIAKHVKDTIRGLEKLYIGCFKDWLPILKDGGKVVIALPVYAVKQREFFVKKVIDTLGVLGYTTVAGPIEYSRPQAVVRRRFFVFQKN